MCGRRISCPQSEPNGRVTTVLRSLWKCNQKNSANQPKKPNLLFIIGGKVSLTKPLSSTPIAALASLHLGLSERSGSILLDTVYAALLKI
jgi:hypothetical protein